MATREISNKLESAEVQKICLRNDTSPYGEVLTRQEIEDSIAQVTDRMYWRGPYQNGLLYNYQDCVTDSGWLCVANKQTYDKPAPIAVGGKITEYPVAPTFVDQGFIGVVQTGHLYTFLKSGWISKIEVYVPELTESTHYKFYIINETDPDNPIVTPVEEPILVEDGWAGIALGSTLVVAGAKFRIVVDALNSGSETVYTGGWTFQDSSQVIVPPLTSGWTKNDGNTTLRIDKTDLDSTDRSTELLSFVAGTEIQFVSTVAPVNSKSFYVTGPPVDAGTYVEYPVSLIAELGSFPEGTATTLTASVPSPLTTNYSVDPDFWLTNTPNDWCTIEAFEKHDGTDVPDVADNCYGVRMTFQEATRSDDWDILAFSEGAGGGGAAASIYAYTKASNVIVTAEHPTWQEIDRVEVPDAGAGIYEYKISVSYTLNSTTTSAYIRFSIDGGTNWSEFRAEPKDVTDTRGVFYAFPIEYAVATPLSLIVEAAKESAVDVMNIEFIDVIIDQK